MLQQGDMCTPFVIQMLYDTYLTPLGRILSIVDCSLHGSFHFCTTAVSI